MGRVLTAFRAFFGALFNAAIAARVEQALKAGAEGGVSGLETTVPVVPPQLQETKPLQNGGITLLAALQREARLIDFLKEDITPYTNEQVGAAVREIHRDSQSVLDRFFSIRSILTEEEGASVEVPAGFDAGRYRLTGKLAGTGPFRGILRHHGWEATQCEMPAFTGSDSAAKTIAPAEVEIL
ncbi:DUF2760 domain-containing protein [Schlesneria sp. T3-172]|uniref:DUF2760 domain-containing protein n=1 Tax=Schlesneria TaxID=656899 RepID=UPI002F19477C